ncbi:MAG TPA: hypothetical protein VK481_09615 [Gemmatimonadaceae bacterium]|nr:hypothetical protein [Gemmatimonadaceae bacterium]
MRLQLRAGIQRVTQKPREFLIALLPSSLGDVRRNRRRRAKELIPQRSILRVANLLTDSIDVERERQRLLPDEKLLEIGHTGE